MEEHILWASQQVKQQSLLFLSPDNQNSSFHACPFHCHIFISLSQFFTFKSYFGFTELLWGRQVYIETESLHKIHILVVFTQGM